MVQQQSTVDKPDAIAPLTATIPTIALSLGAVVAMLVIVNTEILTEAQATDAKFVIPLLQLLLSILILRVRKWPESWFARSVIIFAHISVLLLVRAWFVGQFGWIVYRLISAALRVLIVVLWLSPILTVILVGETFRRGTLRWRPWVPRAIRLGLGTVLVLVGLEGSAFLIERGRLPKKIAESTLPASPTAEVRIAAIGGSTMLGFPYDPVFGIGKVAAWQLRQDFPGQRFVIDNLAETGINLEQAISRIEQLTCLPDFLVVYSGHNEFFYDIEQLTRVRKTAWPVIDNVLGFSAAFRVLNLPVAERLVGHMAPEFQMGLCGLRTCPEYLERQRLYRYQSLLHELFDWAAVNQVTVIYCVPAADEASFAPNGSLCHSTDTKVREQIEAQWRQVLTLHEQQDWQTALKTCEQVLRSEPDFAEFHFLAGRSCRELGQLVKARQYFQAAVDLDQSPVRMKSQYRAVGLAAAEQHGAVVVDCPKILQQLSRDEFLDETFFLDGVHPNLKSTFMIGQAVAHAAAQSAVLSSRATQNHEDSSFGVCLRELGVTAETLALAYTRTTSVLKRYSLLRGAADQRRLREARRFEVLGQRLQAGSILPGQDGAESLSD